MLCQQLTQLNAFTWDRPTCAHKMAMQRPQVDLAVKHQLKRVWVSVRVFYAKWNANSLRAFFFLSFLPFLFLLLLLLSVLGGALTIGPVLLCNPSSLWDKIISNSKIQKLPPLCPPPWPAGPTTLQILATPLAVRAATPTVLINYLSVCKVSA